MNQVPGWIKPAATIVAILIAGILLAGIISVPYRAMKSPSGYDMSRVHLNTKNTTRFDGENIGEVAALVSQAVYPATSEEFIPDVVLLFDPEDWRGGLAATSLLRPLNAVLLPASENSAVVIERLRPSGSQAAGGASVLLLNDLEAPEDVTGQALSQGEILELRSSIGDHPLHAILVDPEEAQMALLAAPWTAYSGDLVIFDENEAPDSVKVYALGDVAFEGENIKRIGGADPAATAVAFASYEDPENPIFGWGMNADSVKTGYRAYSLAPMEEPALALLSANLNIRGKIGPLLWTTERELPAAVDNYLWSQRAAFFVTPVEGPFHHFWILGGEDRISFPAQSQADYAVEIGPYLGKGAGASAVDMLAAAWVVLGIVSAIWILFHQAKFLPHQMWVMQLAWPLLAIFSGPFGILFYYLAYNRPIIKRGKMWMWHRPLWLQGLAATASAVGFGATLMIVTGFITTFFGIPLIPSRVPFLYLLGTPMILIMIINYVVAVLISWLVFQTPMLSMFYGQPYRKTLAKALPMVLASMTVAALAMNPGMWWLMMWHLPMMPSEESILWFGVMFFTGFLAFLLAWPLNYLYVRSFRKSGMM